MTSHLTISKIAKKIGINIETVRYYERIGLITQPQKPVQGFRIYNQKHISKLVFIKRAKALGFTLAEITELLTLESMNCDETKDIALSKLEDIKTKINDLQSMEAILEGLVKACHSKSEYEGCPIISAMTDEYSLDVK